MTNKEYADFAAQLLSSKKATDIMIIDIAEKSGFADYFIIATGNTDRQVNSMADDVEDALAEKDLLVKSIEGKNVSGWILMDERQIQHRKDLGRLSGRAYRRLKHNGRKIQL